MNRSQDPLPLKDLINFLFEHVLHPEGRPYTTQEVTDDVRISHATINQMRTGRSKNPTLPTLQEICRFFDIPLSFFECTSEEACFAILNEKPAAKTEEIAEITFRASQLSEHSQKQLLEVISWIKAAEQVRQETGETPDFPDELDEPL